jgi:hypothetical protein
VDQVIGALDSALAASNSRHTGSRIRSTKAAAA